MSGTSGGNDRHAFQERIRRMAVPEDNGVTAPE